MYRVDIENKKLIKIPVTSFLEMNMRERFDIQEWISGTPDILGEPLLIIAKELVLPSGKRLDLLAVDKQASLVVIELKRDDSGKDIEWQSIKYASYCSSFSQEDIYKHFAEYLGSDDGEAQASIEAFISGELDELNKQQRIILVSKEFHSEVISAVLWLRESEIDVECIRLTPHRDNAGQLFINSEIIIPLPEAKDYIQKKETKQKEQKKTGQSTFSLEKSNLDDSELKSRIVDSLLRLSGLTPRLIAFFTIICREDRPYDREEVKQSLLNFGIGKDMGQAGRYLSNISQFLTKKSNPHLRQVIEFESGGVHGQRKNSYRVVPKHRALVIEAIREATGSDNDSANQVLHRTSG